MNVGIDARMLGPTVGGGGLGRYVEELTQELLQLNSNDRYVLFVKNETQAHGHEHKIAEPHWYSLSEQIKMPRIIDRENLDLIHYPHWNVPLLAKTPFVVTIHDLILLEQPRSARATTLGPIRYAIKYRFFRRVLHHAVSASRAIIAPSQYTKDSIRKHFPKTDPEKIHVVHEGLTHLPKSQTMPTQGKPYVLYVGNAYPHKNLDRLLDAFTLVRQTHPELRLILAGRDDVFGNRLKDRLVKGVEFVTSPTDAELTRLYTGATAYIFPSLCEGFGLPPLEAMSFSVPVAAANASCLPEILGKAAIYFDPHDSNAIARALENLLTDKPLRASLIQAGHAQIKSYSWKTMAEAIQSIYQHCAH